MKLEPKLVCVLLGFIALAGCPGGCTGPLVTDLVTITYRQIFNFNEWEVRDSNGGIVARGGINDGVYMRYRIVSIDNTDSSPKIFRFDPGKVYASEDPSERPVTPVIGLSGALAFDVAPGSIWGTPLNVTIKSKGNPANIRDQVQSLRYENGPGEHVLMINEASQVGSVPFLAPLRIPGANLN